MGLSHCDVERIFICHYQMGGWGGVGVSGIFCGLQCEPRQCIYGGGKKEMWLEEQGWALPGECLVTSAESCLQEPFDSDSKGRDKWNRCANRWEEFDTPTRCLLKNTHLQQCPRPLCNLFSLDERNKHTACFPRGFWHVASAGTTAHQ